MPAKGKDDTRFAALFGGLSLALGLLILLVGAIGWVVTARFVAEALTGVAEVVSSRDYRGRYGNDRCCVTTFAVVGADGSRFTG